MSTVGYKQLKSGFWFKVSDGSGPYTFDGAAFALANASSGGSAATTTTAGTVILATQAQVNAGTDAVTAVTPATLASSASLLAAKRGKGGALRVAFVGDSFVSLAYANGYPCTLGTAIAGICTSDTPWASLGVPVGVGTLAFDGVKYATFAAFGETAGAGVDVSLGGVFTLLSSGGESLLITSTPRLFTGVGVFTASVTLGVVRWQRFATGFPFSFDALMGGRCQIMLFGVSGQRSTDITLRTQQVLDWKPDLICDVYGTNDVVAAALTGDVAAANRVVNWDIWLAAGLPVIATTLSARWGSGDSGNRTDAKQAALVRCNYMLRKAAASRLGVTLVDIYAGSVDPTSVTGAVLTGYTVDGLHPSGSLSWIIGKALAAGAARYSNLSATVSVGADANYDATNNPSGQLITGGQGSFIGTGGTAGTGTATAAAWVTATLYVAGDVVLNTTLGTAYWTPNGGTSAGAAPNHYSGSVADTGGVVWTFITAGATIGFATSWSTNRSTGAAAISRMFKSTDPDGDAPWQEFFVTNFGAGEASAFVANPAVLVIGNFTVGDIIEGFIEFDIQGVGCTGAYTSLNLAGGLMAGGNLGQNNVFSGVLPGITGRFTLHCDPFHFQAGCTSVQARFFLGGASGCVFRARVRNFVWRKVT